MIGEANDEIDSTVCEECLESLDFCECAVDALRALFEKFEDTDYLKYHDIHPEDKPSRSDLNAFIKLNELVPGNQNIVMSAEHDKIWLGVELDDLAKVATSNDVLYLVRCGVMVDENGLCMFV